MSPSSSMRSEKIKSNIAAITFFAKTHTGDVCGSNGLPLIQNSIAILGRSQILKTFNHKNLCEYLDIIRGKHERTIIVSEYFGRPLNEIDKNYFTEDIIWRIIYQIVDGLCYIENKNFVHHNLDSSNILLDHLNNIKLFNYGLFYMTKDGEYVSFPIGNIKYMSPERLLGSKNNIKSDVWSLGIIIAELMFQCSLWSNLNIGQIMRKILSCCNTKNILEKLARENDCMDKYLNMNPKLIEIVEKCLTISPSERFSPSDILKVSYFQENLQDMLYTSNPLPDSLLLQCPLKQIYYWWQLAGGDVYTELKKECLIKSEAPILLMPKLVLLNGQTIVPPKTKSFMLDNRILLLNLVNLTERLANVNPRAFFPLIHTPKFAIKFGTDMMDYSLYIREKNIEYQFYRVILFTRLLKGYPYTRNLIIEESQIDIPPFLRGEVWACILGVLENNTYETIDKSTPNSTDRQIDVDIPRCHQYAELLSSPEGHKKLKRLLKAWVTTHPQYVYWQGLDSLTAPFLYLNFNNEERAFLSLYKFIPKYLHLFFLKDNSVIIKEYLCKFSQLTAYHEPILAKHLKSINFIPELFAIPWFLTMFSHVFPLHKIIHLWDKLILGDNSYPLFIGIAVLKQLKATLLKSCFNECILLFSDLPDIQMDICVSESQTMYTSTPKSITYRKNVILDQEPDEYDVNDVELSDLNEICPRISARDLTNLIINDGSSCAIIDLRSNIEFERAHVKHSINIPFTSIQLAEPNISQLNIPELESKLRNKIVIIISSIHDYAVLFSNYLIECGIARVCILHKGFNILHSVIPNILTSL